MPAMLQFMGWSSALTEKAAARRLRASATRRVAPMRTPLVAPRGILVDERPELALVEDGGRLRDQVGELGVSEQAETTVEML
jgi:hypothetical protein